MYGTCGRIDNKADFDFDFDSLGWALGLEWAPDIALELQYILWSGLWSGFQDCAFPGADSGITLSGVDSGIALSETDLGDCVLWNGFGDCTLWSGFGHCALWNRFGGLCTRIVDCALWSRFGDLTLWNGFGDCALCSGLGDCALWNRFGDCVPESWIALSGAYLGIGLSGMDSGIALSGADSGIAYRTRGLRQVLCTIWPVLQPGIKQSQAGFVWSEENRPPDWAWFLPRLFSFWSFGSLPLSPLACLVVDTWLIAQTLLEESWTGWWHHWIINELTLAGKKWLFVIVLLHYWNYFPVYPLKLLWHNQYCIKCYRNKGDLTWLDMERTWGLRTGLGIALSGGDSGIALSGADLRIALSEADSETLLSGTTGIADGLGSGTGSEVRPAWGSYWWLLHSHPSWHYWRVYWCWKSDPYLMKPSFWP